MAGTPEGARKARAKLSDEAKALGLTVAEYRARRRAAKLTSAETRTIVQVTPEPVAARVTPPPAGTPQPEAPGHAPEAPRARPSPEPEPEQPTPLPPCLRRYGGAPPRAASSAARPECVDAYALRD